jgi:hypothetical protein
VDGHHDVPSDGFVGFRAAAEHRHRAGLGEAMAQTTRDCPNCPDVPMIAFLLTLVADLALTCATSPSVGRSRNRTSKRRFRAAFKPTNWSLRA